LSKINSLGALHTIKKPPSKDSLLHALELANKALEEQKKP